jgi:hypothetical protein
MRPISPKRRFYAWLLALVLFNFSIDIDGDLRAPGQRIGEAEVYNEIETIVEWILERGLSIENAVPESENNDESGALSKSQVFYNYLSLDLPPFIFSTSGHSLPPYWGLPMRLCVRDLAPPPEDAAIFSGAIHA